MLFENKNFIILFIKTKHFTLKEAYLLEISLFKFSETMFIKAVSQTLFGNPEGPVELGNPNTCAETKLCLNFIIKSGLRSISL